jgi:hypothetical protein
MKTGKSTIKEENNKNRIIKCDFASGKDKSANYIIIGEKMYVIQKK